MNIFEARKVLMWNKRLLDIMGLWPLNLNNWKFSFFFSYIAVQCFLQYAALVENISDLNYVVLNLTETVGLSMTFFKIAIYRIISKQLRELIQNIEKDYSKEVYSTANEIKPFLQYNLLSKTIVQWLSILSASAVLFFYMQPLVTHLLASNDRNSSSSFILPFHIRLFFDLTQARTYYIIYACEIFVVPIAVCGFVGTNNLLVTLVLHICGQFSVLTTKVENMMDDTGNLHDKLKWIVTKHCRLIRLIAKLDSVYSAFLLQELFGITVLTCLGSYNVVATSVLTERTDFLRFLSFMFSIISLLAGFCYIGECLITESSYLCNAFYNCEWYNLPPEHAKVLLICILQSQRPLALTAGRFFTFSLENFIGVVKTSLGYLSVLRKFV